MDNAEASQLTRLSLEFERASHTLPALTIYETQDTRLGSWLRTKKLMVGLCGMHLDECWLTINIAPRRKPRTIEFKARAAAAYEGIAYRTLLHST